VNEVSEVWLMQWDGEPWRAACW